MVCKLSGHVMELNGDAVIFLPRPFGGDPIWTVRGRYSNVQCLACWQPKAGDGWTPATIAESYVNRANPGVNDAFNGTAPAWAAATGWTFLNALAQYLRTGLVPAGAGYSLVVRYNSATWAAGYRVLAGGDDAASRGIGLWMRSTPNRLYMNQQVAVTADAASVAGTMAVAGQQGYFNGAANGAAIAAGATTWKEIYLGALNSNGAPAQYCSATITWLGVYSVALDVADNANLHADLVAGGF